MGTDVRARWDIARQNGQGQGGRPHAVLRLRAPGHRSSDAGLPGGRDGAAGPDRRRNAVLQEADSHIADMLIRASEEAQSTAPSFDKRLSTTTPIIASCTRPSSSRSSTR